MQTIGNTDLLNTLAVGFLCSRKPAAGAILRCYDWALQMKNEGICVIGGFHSPLEQDVFHLLIQGTQPVIWVLHTGLKKTYPAIVEKAISEDRLLIISPFTEPPYRPTEDSTRIRNEFILKQVSKLVIGYASPGGSLETLLKGYIGEVERLWG